MSDERVPVKFFDRGFGVFIEENSVVHVDYRNPDGTVYLRGTFPAGSLPSSLRRPPVFTVKMTMDEFELLGEWLTIRKSEERLRLNRGRKDQRPRKPSVRSWRQ